MGKYQSIHFLDLAEEHSPALGASQDASLAVSLGRAPGECTIVEGAPLGRRCERCLCLFFAVECASEEAAPGDDEYGENAQNDTKCSVHIPSCPRIEIIFKTTLFRPPVVGERCVSNDGSSYQTSNRRILFIITLLGAK